MSEHVKCPNRETLDALLEGTLEPEQVFEIENHVGNCDRCQDSIDSLVQDDRWQEWKALLDDEISTLEISDGKSDSANPDPLSPGSSVSRVSVFGESTAALPAIDGFRVTREIGRGGMGVVYEALDESLNRRVAIKMLVAGAMSGPDRLARFRNEAEVVARLKHPHIVQIYSIGEHDGLPFLVLEFIDGPNLAEFYRIHPMSVREAAKCVASTASAIQFAHDNGVVHRDLKPANLLVPDAIGIMPKLTDFGLARQFDSDTHSVTGTLLGTPSYMAPEVINGTAGLFPTSADVYGLGALLYYLLVGDPPFRASVPAETLAAVANSPAKIPPNVSLPNDLQVVTLKCLEKRPQDRYASAGELAGDLNRFLDHRPIHARPISVAGRLWRYCKRRPAISGLVATLLVCLASAFFMIAEQSRATRSFQVKNKKLLQQTTAMQSVVDLGKYVRTLADATHAWHGNDYDRMRSLLAGCPTDFRSCEWGLLEHIAQNGYSDCHRMPSGITAFSQEWNGLMAIGCKTGQVDVCRRMLNGDQLLEPVCSSQLDSEAVVVLKWTASPLKLDENPADNLLLVGMKNKVVCLRLVDGQLKTEFELPAEGLSGIAIDPNHQAFAVCTKKGVIAHHELSGGKVVSTQSYLKSSFVGIGWDKNRLLLVEESWHLRSCNSIDLKLDPMIEIQRGQETAETVRSAWFDVPRGRVVLNCSDNYVRIAHHDSGKRINSLVGHSEPVLNAAILSGKNRLATCDAGGTTRLWNIGAQQNVDDAPQIVSRKSVGATAWLANGRFVVIGDSSGTVLIYPAAAEARHSLDEVTSGSVPGHQTNYLPGNLIEASPGGQYVVTSGYDARVVVRDAESLETIRELPKHPDRIRGLGIFRDGERIVTASHDGFFREFALQTGELIFETQIFKGSATALSCSADGRHIAVGGTPKGVVLWDGIERKIVRTFTDGVERTIREVNFNCDGSRLIVACGPEVLVFDTQTGKKIFGLPGHAGRAYKCRFSDDDQWIATSANDNATRIWDGDTGERIALFRNSDLLGFTPDSKRVILSTMEGMWAKFQFVDLVSGFTLWNTRVNPNEIGNIRFSPDGSRLFAVDDKRRLQSWQISAP